MLSQKFLLNVKPTNKGLMLNKLNQELVSINLSLKVQKEEIVRAHYEGQNAIINKLIAFVNSVDTLK